MQRVIIYLYRVTGILNRLVSIAIKCYKYRVINTDHVQGELFNYVR